MSNIVHLRLINGDELIAEIEKTTKNELFLLKPMIVSEITDVTSSQSTIILSKYILFDNDVAISISKNHVITNTSVLKEIESYYRNSIEYNSKFVDPLVENELVKVNQALMSRLQDDAPTFDNHTIKMVYLPASNTLH